MSIQNSIASFIAKTVSNFLNSYTINQKMEVSNRPIGSPHRAALMEMLCEIEKRVQGLPENDANRMRFEGMKISMGSQLKMAVSDWDNFCVRYHCFIGYNDHVKSSKCFYIYIKEKSWPMAPADWEVKFKNLPKIEG